MSLVPGGESAGATRRHELGAAEQQSKRAEARVRLAPVYCWFTEGFDTADLQEEGAAGGVGGITQGEPYTAETFRPTWSPGYLEGV
jgi:hypothetical protein